MSKSVPIQSIQRALVLLDYVTAESLRGDGVTLQAAAARLGVPATTAHNIVRTMIACGYLCRDGEHRYHPGPRCADIARGSRLAGELLETATRVVHLLAEQSGESAVLATLIQGHRFPLVHASGSEVVRVTASFEEQGRFFELVTGRVLAAYATAAERRAVLEAHGLPGELWGGITDEEGLSVALAEIRQHGIAEDQPSGGQVHALAVPVLEAQGRLLAALGLYLPAFRASEERLTELRAAAREAAARIGGGRTREA